MGKKIFILEDNDDLRELYNYIFEGEKYQIKTFASVTAFMERAHEIPDLYLLDVMLPDGDGIQLCKELKQNINTANVPVIMVSAHKGMSDVNIQCPGADFIPKPFDIEYLLRTIDSKIDMP